MTIMMMIELRRFIAISNNHIESMIIYSISLGIES